MPYFVTPVSPEGAPGENTLNQPVPVGVIDQSVLDPLNVRGEDHTLVILTNLTGDTFEGSSASSPNGVNQWVPELNDEFASIGPNSSRRMLLSADRLFIRVTGRFLTTPGNINMSVIKLREAGKRSS